MLTTGCRGPHTAGCHRSRPPLTRTPAPTGLRCVPGRGQPPPGQASPGPPSSRPPALPRPQAQMLSGEETRPRRWPLPPLPPPRESRGVGGPHPGVEGNGGQPRHSPKSRNCLMERGEGEKRE